MFDLKLSETYRNKPISNAYRLKLTKLKLHVSFGPVLIETEMKPAKP